MRIFQKATWFITILLPLLFSAQRGKDGSITISNTRIVNEFTSLTSNVGAGATTFSVIQSSLNTNNRFSGTLASGDLLLIIQMQGVTVNQVNNTISWGAVTNYNNCGNYEYVEVASVPNATTINLRCGLRYDYTSSGKVQVIRVPRYTDLTLTGTIITEPWNGTTGGIVAIESLNDLIISSGTINVNGLGFRGGQSALLNSVYGGQRFNDNNTIADEGAAKGESIAGFTTEYSAITGVYCKGAIANGGGGGNGHNGGGGGGANAGDINSWNNGVGVPSTTYNTMWNLEIPSIANASSSGGGRGGYTFSSNNSGPSSTAPGNTAWGGDFRRNQGGLGGRPLDYSTEKLFLGGGGGAGDMNNSNSTGGSGANGGGMIVIRCFGSLSGTGTIQANGADAIATSAPSAPFLGYAGNDAAGGGGGGGTILLNVDGTVNGISCSANGGTGGNQNLIKNPSFVTVNEAEGPGGGGGGGYIGYTNSTISTSVNGGLNGVTNSDAHGAFPPNGATSGGVGTVNNSLPNYNVSVENDTICQGFTSTLNATISGVPPLGTVITWYDAETNGTILGTGNSFTTPIIGSNTTYYIGLCPGNHTIPVSVIMHPTVAYNDNTISISDENCGQMDGGITGISVNGGTAPFSYEWNTVPTPSINLGNVSAGNYTLIITDDNGCEDTTVPYTIGLNTGPVIDISNANIMDESCGQSNGTILGITATGQGTLTYEWNNQPSATPDIGGLAAGNYTLEVTDGAGCSITSGPYTLTNMAGPMIDTSSVSINHPLCNQQNGSIEGANSLGGLLPVAYYWNGNLTPSPPDLINATAGDYTFTVIDAFGCRDSIVFTLDPTGAPEIDSTGVVTSNEHCGLSDGAIWGITSSGGSGALTYRWNGQNTTSYNISDLSSGSYMLTITDGAGCSDSSGPYTISTIPGPVLDTSLMIIVAATCGQSNGSITGINATGGSTPISYFWDNTLYPFPPDLINSSGDSYYFAVIDAFGCTDSALITLPNIGNPLVDAGLDITIAAGESTTLNAIGNGSLVWSPTTGLSCTACPAPVANPSETTTYTVTITDTNGCTHSDTMTVFVESCGEIFVPNAFSPDGTGNNEKECVFGGCFTTMTFTIYNRWGELVFETNDPDECWDGTYKNEKINTGVFVYTLSGTRINGEEVSKQGTISVFR